MKLEGQATIITGGGSGLGAETAACLARAGASVAVLDVNIKAAVDCANKIGGLAIECDVADADSVAAAFARAHEEQGPPRIVVSCAGVTTAKQIMTLQTPPDKQAFDRVISVSIAGNFNVMRHAAIHMAKLDPLPSGERGVIISGTAVAPCERQARGHGAYAIVKNETLMLGRPPLSEASRNGIRVVTMVPGVSLNQFLQNLPGEVEGELSSSLPAVKQADPVTSFAAFIAHFIEQPFLIQEVLRVDAALTMQALSRNLNIGLI